MSLIFKNTPFLKKNTVSSRKIATNFKIDRNDNHYDKNYNKCKDCKYSMNMNGTLECTLFKYYTIITENYNFDYYVDTTVARNDNKLCGPYGEYFKPKKLF